MTTETLDQVETEEVIEPEAVVATEGEPEEAEVIEPQHEAITFKTQKELDDFVTKKASSLADSIANKGTATYQKQVEDLKKELAETKSQLEYKQDDDALDKLEKAQTETWSDESQQDVGDFQEAVRKLVQDRRGFRQQVKDWEGKHELATQEARNVNAFTRALKLLLPEDQDEFVPALEELAKKLAGAKTDREADLIYELEEGRLRAKAEAPPKVKRTRPDSNLVTAVGGEDISTLTPREKMDRGLDKLKKK